MTERRPLAIAIGGVFHETHSFSPRRTGVAEFRWQAGADLLEQTRGAGTTLGGILHEIEARGHRPVPLAFAAAAPGGLVDDALMNRLRAAIEEALHGSGSIDGIALELHGAMATETESDAEGALLDWIRKRVGAVPMAAGLDLHAHVTPRMLRAADILTACRENPHRDVFDCGRRVARLLEETARGRIRPVSALAKARMILPGRSETGAGPLCELHAEARTRQDEAERLLDLSLFNVYPYGNGTDMGQAALVITDADPDLASTTATHFARAFWDRRNDFGENLPDIAVAISKVVHRPTGRPFLFADMGDRVLAGAPGDSVEILRAARLAGLRTAATVTDASAVAKACTAGQGARLTLSLGGADTPGLAPLEVSAEVRGIGPGHFTVAGPYKQGARIDLGETATLGLDEGSVVIATSQPGFIHDPAGFVAHGADPADFDLVVVKSGHHFKLNFAGMGTPMAVGSPGLSRYMPGAIPWTESRLWPEHDVTDRPILGPWVVEEKRAPA